MKKYLIIIVVLSSLLSSCGGYKEIAIGNIELEKIKLTSTSKADIVFGIDVYNPTKSNFILTDMQGVLFKDDIPFANITLLEDVSIPLNFNGEIFLKSRVELLDPMAILVMGLNIKSWDMDEFKIKIKATVKKGAFKKTFKLNNIPLNKVVKKIKL